MTNKKFSVNVVPAGTVKGVNIPFIVFTPTGSYSGCPVLTFEQDNCLTMKDAIQQTVLDVTARCDNGYPISGPVIVPILPSESEFKASLSRFDKKLDIGNSKVLSRGCFSAEIPVSALYYRLDEQIDKILLAVDIYSPFVCFGVGQSALTAMRYAMISPVGVKKLVVGDCGSSIPIITGRAAKSLDYPFGLRDRDILFGKRVKRDMYKNIDFEFFTNERELASISRDDDMSCPADVAEQYNLKCGTPVYDRMVTAMSEYMKDVLNVHLKVYPGDTGISAQDYADVVYGTESFSCYPVQVLTDARHV